MAAGFTPRVINLPDLKLRFFVVSRKKEQEIKVYNEQLANFFPGNSNFLYPGILINQVFSARILYVFEKHLARGILQS